MAVNQLISNNYLVDNTINNNNSNAINSDLCDLDQNCFDAYLSENDTFSSDTSDVDLLLAHIQEVTSDLPVLEVDDCCLKNNENCSNDNNLLSTDNNQKANFDHSSYLQENATNSSDNTCSTQTYSPPSYNYQVNNFVQQENVTNPHLSNNLLPANYNQETITDISAFDQYGVDPYLSESDCDSVQCDDEFLNFLAGLIIITMKSPPAVVTDDCDDIFGPPRTYPSGYSPPKNRPSMISPKYRQKEERRKVLKISIHKLKKIDDPESSLCRSVLINNTMKRLQKEARDEKQQKQQLNYPRCYENDNFLNIKNEFLKNENNKPLLVNYDETQDEFMVPAGSVDDHTTPTFVVENDFDTKLAEEINTVNGLVDTSCNNFTINTTDMLIDNNSNNDRFSARKRSFDEMEDCDVQEVLSQFYMPPTPRMLTSIDDDEDVIVNTTTTSLNNNKHIKLADNVVDNSNSMETDIVEENACDKMNEFSVNNFSNNNNLTTSDSRLRYSNQNDTDSNPFSCGHASMFNELQSNVYHNLIASLET